MFFKNKNCPDYDKNSAKAFNLIFTHWEFLFMIKMFNLHLLNEIFTNGFKYSFLNYISLVAILCGILVIISKNPIVSVLFLIGLFLSVSGYLMMLGINFIGLSYLLVYVGAVSILFLFILMLINVRISELVSDTSNSIPLAIIIGIFFNSTVYDILPLKGAAFNNNIQSINFSNSFDVNNFSNYLKELFAQNFSNDSEEILFVSSQMWEANLAETSHISTIGNILYTSYPIWLIITSIILLLAMVGAIVITIKK